MGKGVPRAALLALAFLLLASPLAWVGQAQASPTPTYTLLGYVEGPGGVNAPPVPAGVTVVLTSSASGQTYSTQTSLSSGQFTFSSSSNAPGLQPGWWGLSVPPQTHATLQGAGGVSLPGEYAVLPLNQSAQYLYLNATALTNSAPQYIHDVSIDQENVTVNGTVSFQGRPYAGASVAVLAPTFNSFALANNTTTNVNNKSQNLHTGYFSMKVPWGSWVLVTTIPGVPNYYNYTPLVVNTAPVTTNLTVNPSVVSSKSFTTWGYVNLAPPKTGRDPNGGNVTVFEVAGPSPGSIFHSAVVPGGFYSVGTEGPGTYLVTIATVGCQTVSYTLTVTALNPSGSVPHNVNVVCGQAPPAAYATVLNWSTGFGKLNVTTHAVLANDSVLPQLANASIGQLWAQLALDWQHNLTFAQANFAKVAAWVASGGPFFPAGQAGTTVNGTGYGQPANVTFSSASGCLTFCGVNNAAMAWFNWTQNYNLTAKSTGNLKSYPVSFSFKHPTNGQSFNYTVLLPKGYVLSAGTAVPSQSALVPAGPSGTWTSFTLVSKPSPSAGGTLAFTAVKNGTVTASVNVSAKEFTWSNRNVLNTSRGNYTAIAGVGENLTFSGLNSTFPAGTNGTLYAWTFGDGGLNSTKNATTNHTYQTAGKFVGSLVLTSSGGAKSTVPFTIYAGSTKPQAVITVNSTKVQTASNGIPYLIVNWSTPLQLNASKSVSTINAGGAPSGRISVAFWNLTDSTSQTYNLTNANGGSRGVNNALSNITNTFVNKGHYVTQGTANGTPIPGTFFGWQYNVTLTVWDYGGRNSTAHMVILVRDTQKPVPVVVLKNGAGKPIPASGLVEGANHTALVVLWATNSSDPGNGSIAKYHWKVTDTSNKSANWTFDRASSAPGFPVPGGISVWLPPQKGAYTVNLTVTDRANNSAYLTTPLTVAVNLSVRPILSVSNLTAPTTMTDGSSYTISVNVTNLGGNASVARNVSVRFYLLPPSGSGVPITIGGSPGAVSFYGWINHTKLASTANATGLFSLAYNHSARAQIQFTPSRTGTWDVWVNATASNEFAPDYTSGENQAHVQVTLNPNPIIADEEIAAVVGAVALAIILIVLFYRRKRAPKASSKGSGGGGKLERGASKKDEDDEE
ncbi:MAG TPA: PKD domain-containing protein [Thermoplasmata archaeon]|nr:PKD domain-containing protein [Thermoplasmata archaeon]